MLKYTFLSLIYRHLVLLVLVGISSEALATHVEALWSGALQAHSIRVNAKISGAASTRLVVSRDEQNFSNPIYSEYVLAKGQNDFVVSLYAWGLTPNTTYYYRVELNGNIDFSDKAKGRFHTPADGPYSFSFAFGSCMGGSSNRQVFETIANQGVLFFLHTGDMHYRNIGSDCENNFRGAYADILGSERQSSMYRHIPMAYMWDDHDYGPNDSDTYSPCKETARTFYQRYVPHYSLAAGQGNVPISQSFVIGRLRFILSDLRSEKKKPVFEPNSCDKAQNGTNFGFQLSWFKSELLKAKQEGQMAVWVSGIPYINGPGGPNYHCKEDDNWGGFPEERQEIANFIRDHQIPVVIVGGDAHMTSIDDGRNSDYANGGGAPIPVFHGGSLDRGGSLKGGPYSHGYKKDGGQFGLFSVIDDGTDVLGVSWRGMNEQGNIITSEDLGSPISLDFKVALDKPVTFPVDFVAVDISQKQQGVLLNWQTVHELNLSHYAIERSIDQQVYEHIGAIDAGHNSYSFIDDFPVSGRWYYRVKGVDLDGSLTLSEVKSININPVTLSMNCYPNPYKEEFTVDIYSKDEVVELQIFDMQGRVIKQKIIRMHGRRSTLGIDMSGFPPQLYTVKVLTTERQIVQRILGK